MRLISRSPEELAQLFHETYERLAPSHGYETRKDSAVPWKAVPEKNKNLMIAVCAEIITQTKPQ
jgi:trehalose-6-phosphatase